MQQLYEKIFNMACEEIPHRVFVFGNERCVIYRGFKISELDGIYSWQDIRDNSFYDPVDPIITNQILKKGFVKTLTEMMVHGDKERLYQLQERVKEIDRTIKYWVNKSSENYRNQKKTETGILSNLKLTQEQIEHKLETLNKKYLKNKNLYVKKRRVLKEEREEVEAQVTFYKTRIKLYN